MAFRSVTPRDVGMKKVSPVSGRAASWLPGGKQWTLVWHDEFDGDTLDEHKWNFRRNFWGYPSPTFTDQGVELDGHSHLRIHLVNENGVFRSAHLQTGALTFDEPRESPGAMWRFGKRAPAKFMHRYGYYEIRCRLPKHDGWHAAFWLQSPSIGAHPDPAQCGVECDIMENYRQHSHGEILCGCGWDGYGPDSKWFGHFAFPYQETDDGWHSYAVDWTPAGYIFYADGREVGRQMAPECAVSNVDQFVLVSTECHGYHRRFTERGEAGESANAPGWSGQPVAELFHAMPDCFEVDFVRVFDAVQ